MEKETPLTSTRSINKKAGFTLVELGVVILVLAMLAALVAPRLVAFQRTQEYRTFVSQTRAIFSEAREAAIERKAACVLTIDGRSIQLAPLSEDSDAQAIRTVSMPDGVEVSTVRLNGSQSNETEWRVAFYPDGSATKAGIEFDSDGRIFAMQVDDVTGRTELIDDTLPEETQTRWEAGEREQRGGG